MYSNPGWEVGVPARSVSTNPNVAALVYVMLLTGFIAQYPVGTFERAVVIMPYRCM